VPAILSAYFPGGRAGSGRTPAPIIRVAFLSGEKRANFVSSFGSCKVDQLLGREKETVNFSKSDKVSRFAGLAKGLFQSLLCGKSETSEPNALLFALVLEFP
jgi:hypothetical protein